MFFKTQHFNNILLGNKQMNKMGLHIARIKLSNMCRKMRCLKSPQLIYHEELKKDGVISIPDFLEEKDFIALQSEIRNTFKSVEAKLPLRDRKGKGYSKKYPFEGGFDRYDGSTLNRYLNIDNKSTPEAYQFTENKLLQQIYTNAIGCIHKLSKFSIYQTTYQEQSGDYDVQSILHRDTFQPALKLWYFTESVNQDDGAFEYIIGSHHLNKSRMKWEKQRSIKASRPTNDSNGAFRLSEEERLNLGYPKPTSFFVKENTLIIADVRGFHRRGDGKSNHKRYSIYANFRPHPFIPFRY